MFCGAGMHTLNNMSGINSCEAVHWRSYHLYMYKIAEDINLQAQEHPLSSIRTLKPFPALLPGEECPPTKRKPSLWRRHSRLCEWVVRSKGTSPCGY